MNVGEPILSISFFRTETGREPVREWLKSLPREERRIIGKDLKTVQFGWPLGMPLVRKLDINDGKFAPICPTALPGLSSPVARAK